MMDRPPKSIALAVCVVALAAVPIVGQYYHAKGPAWLRAAAYTDRSGMTGNLPVILACTVLSAALVCALMNILMSPDD